MKWFKHYSTARNDEKIALLEDKTGLEGYGFYFKMLEIVAEGIDETDKHDVTYSLSRWGRQANITTKKFLYLIQCCSDVGLMLTQRESDNITVKIPNLLKFRDNHTRNLQVTYKQDKEKEEDKDIDKDKEKPSKVKKSYNYDDYPEFLEFWSAYPLKDGKMEALKSWVNTKPPIDKVIYAIAWQKESSKWKKGYIPMASTYLNQMRWQDEQPTESPF